MIYDFKLLYNESVFELIKVNFDETKAKAEIDAIFNFCFKGTNWNNDRKILKRIRCCVRQRKKQKPLAYILGSEMCYGLEFSVGPGVLIPKPGTDSYVEEALKNLEGKKSPVVVDLCSGSGCMGIPIAYHRQDALVYLVEKSRKAFFYLEKNTQKYSLKNAKPIKADIFKVESVHNIDLIIANPPYAGEEDMKFLPEEMRYEPRMAFDGGKDGFDFYEKILKKWLPELKKDGTIILGAAQSTDRVLDLLKINGLKTNSFLDSYENSMIIVGKFE